MPLNAGQLSSRITLEQRNAGLDAHGQASETWATVATVWAQPMPKTGREFFAGGQLQAELGFAWRIRHRTDVLPAWRVVDAAGTNYDIAAIVPAANREWLDLMCITGVRDGA